MKTLQDILYKVSILGIHGEPGRDVRALVIDSRKVEGGDCFIAVKGTAVDGHAFIETAIEKGARSVICESMPENLSGDRVAK